MHYTVDIPAKASYHEWMTILEALDDEALGLGKHFAGESFHAWRVFLEACFGLPISDPEIYTACTGRTDQPGRAREIICLAGRRSGKSRISALLSVWIGAVSASLDPPKRAVGERLVISVIACDRAQARVVYRYAVGLLKGSRLLAALIQNETAECISLTTGVDLQIQTCSSKSSRGHSGLAVILDEVAFFRSDESSDPDTDLVNAIMPTLATTDGPLIAISSPYAKRGIAWEKYRRHFGKDGDVLVWVAPTRTMNPTVPQSVIDRAMEQDPAAARSEYLAEFRSDVGQLLTLEAIMACVDGVFERPPMPGVHYVAHVDPSGGSSDSMALAIAHVDGDGIPVLDAVREARPPFSPRAVVREFAQLLEGYGVQNVRGDRYAGEWPRELFREMGLSYEVAERTASEAYLAFLPLLNSGRVRLLENHRLVSQLAGLERRTSAVGRDIVTHPTRTTHDDVANASAMALLLAADTASTGDAQIIAANLATTPTRTGITDEPSDLLVAASWRDEW
jgi:hypothetical protein